MIDYEFGTWGLGFIFRISGSVFPKAIIISIPNAMMVWVVKEAFNAWNDSDPETAQMLTSTGSSFTSLWAGYTMVLGFLLVFRTQIAYSRFWEGATVLQGVRGVWFNATSNLISFSSDQPEKRHEVLQFQHLLVRLMSMLFCTALQQVAVTDDDKFEIIGEEGISHEHLIYLVNARDKCEVILQWVQKLIVKNISSGVLPIAPPILSRVFQELSTGIVDVQGAKKIKEFPFPFPYAQMISCFLILHWLINPVICAILIQSTFMGALVSFAASFANWSINYIAAEIEMPFGDDDNDMPLHALQINFNKSLATLMDPMAQHPPHFCFDPDEHTHVRRSRARYLGCTTERITVIEQKVRRSQMGLHLESDPERWNSLATVESSGEWLKPRKFSMPPNHGDGCAVANSPLHSPGRGASKGCKENISNLSNYSSHTSNGNRDSDADPTRAPPETPRLVGSLHASAAMPSPSGVAEDKRSTVPAKPSNKELVENQAAFSIRDSIGRSGGSTSIRDSDDRRGGQGVSPVVPAEDAVDLPIWSSPGGDNKQRQGDSEASSRGNCCGAI